MLLNLPRAQALMHQSGVDALVATSPANVTYCADYDDWIAPLLREYMVMPGASDHLAVAALAVVPREGTAAGAALIVHPLFAVNALDSWMADLHIYGAAGMDNALPPTRLRAEFRRLHALLAAAPQHPTPVDALVSVLRSRGLAGARLGVEMAGLHPQDRETLVAALPGAQILDCTNLLRLLRAVKSEAEIARLRRAAEVSEQAGMESLALARPGLHVADIAQHYRARVAASGAAFEHFTFGINGMGLAAAPAYVLRADDVLNVDFGCLWRRYVSDTATTLALQPLSAPLQARYDALRDCITAGMAALRPGVRASAVHAAMWDIARTRDIATANPHGHGFGIELRDYPILVAANGRRIRDDCVDVASDLPLETGMALNLEAGIFLPGVASLVVERSFLVTADGAQPLVPQARQQPVVPTG